MSGPTTVMEVRGLSKVYERGVTDSHRLWRRLRQRLRPGPPDDADRIWALRDATFEVEEGEVLGLVGANGAGKSTLLKVISRITAPTEGEAILRGRVASLLEVGTGFHPELTGRENVFLSGAILGMRTSEVRRHFDEIVDFAGLAEAIDTPVKRYSSGMYVRLGFAVAAHLVAEVLLIDEVLAVGDAAFQSKCLGKMREVATGGRTILFVSHNLAAVRKLCTRALLLQGGRVIAAGSADEVVEQYLRTVSAAEAGPKRLPPGYLFRTEPAPEEEWAITGIQLLDGRGEAMDVLRTWDPVRLRIWYQVKRPVDRGSVVLNVQTPEGVVLSLCSTQPDSTVPCPLELGTGYADCFFPRWPYAAGEYLIGAGLAIPGMHFLCWRPEAARPKVWEEDVYGSGLAPSSRRYLVATDHRWELPGPSASRATRPPQPLEPRRRDE
jgi:lipopolysaccharide transport system ATP-binding protein